ncbi:membrane bound phosphatase with 3 transmembrane domains and a dual specificity phosphatase [Cryptosporidium ryanae]|uniref:membrane bound phosphatase with 3 transmembrane domains and a dual specificity phosphatase n=1 Tax=Cryptosporidium ryanae TaxID=515981 RepID=UPI00351AAA70|nr:membrane bound phosphatase with 3 transmembrane domains and a dual specificity phosphatase [Cryptosporidium ryanae]
MNKMPVNLLSSLKQRKIFESGRNSNAKLALNKIVRTVSSPLVHSMIITLCVIHVLLLIITAITGKVSKFENYYEIYTFMFINKVLSVYCLYDSAIIFMYIFRLVMTNYRTNLNYYRNTILRNSIEFCINISVSILSMTNKLNYVIGIGKLVGYAVNIRRLTIILRKQVGQNKRFYTTDEYCLDLVYITDRIIAMGLPALNIEAIYRNPIDEVSAFFSAKYPKKHMIINLCNERELYPLDYFHNIISCPFPDHQVPTLGSLFIICFIILNYLVNKDNVVAIHCKGGKGRTGMVVVAWLLYSRLCTTLDEALKYYSHRRTDFSIPGRVKTIKNPSQIRFMEYFFFLMKNSFPSSVDKLGSDFFLEDLQRGFKSGYSWNVGISGLRRINRKGERRNWKVSDLVKDRCLYIPPCLIKSTKVRPISIEIENNSQNSNFNINPQQYEWRIYLHSEYNRNGDYLIRNVSSNTDFSLKASDVYNNINSDLNIKEKEYHVYVLCDLSESHNLLINYFNGKKENIITSIKSRIESLLIDLKTRPFGNDIISRYESISNDSQVWLDKEFAIKIFGNQESDTSISFLTDNLKSDVDTNKYHVSSSCVDSSESDLSELNRIGFNYGEKKIQRAPRNTGQSSNEMSGVSNTNVDSQESSQLLRSVSLIDISNPDSKRYFNKDTITAINSPYKDIVGYPIKKIREWGAAGQITPRLGTPLAHIWLHPALLHTTENSNMWTFYIEWDEKSSSWVIRDCYVTIQLNSKEIDIRSPKFINAKTRITFQYY